MSTRSHIGYVENNKVRVVYCHYDGYVSYNGVMLYENYKTLDKVKKLVEGGAFSSLVKNVEDINYYGDESYIQYDSIKEYLKDLQDDPFIEYNYLFINNKWIVMENSNPKTKIDLAKHPDILEYIKDNEPSSNHSDKNNDIKYQVLKEVVNYIHKAVSLGQKLSNEKRTSSFIKVFNTAFINLSDQYPNSNQYTLNKNNELIYGCQFIDTNGEELLDINLYTNEKGEPMSITVLYKDKNGKIIVNTYTIDKVLPPKLMHRLPNNTKEKLYKMTGKKL